MAKNSVKKYVFGKLNGGGKTLLKQANVEVKRINLQHENERIAIFAEYSKDINSEHERYERVRESIMVSFHWHLTNIKLRNINQRTAIERQLRDLKEWRLFECKGVKDKEQRRSIIEEYERLRSVQIDMIACLTQSYDRQKQFIYEKKKKALAENNLLHSETLRELLDNKKRKLIEAESKRDRLIDELILKYGNAEGLFATEGFANNK